MTMRALQKPCRVMLVDDHKFVAEMLAQRLATETGIEVAGFASDAAGAEKLISSQHVDIALLDMQLEREDGLGVARRLLELRPSLRIIGLSVHDHDHYPLALLQMGAAGFLSKHSSAREIADGVRRVAAGEMAVSASVAVFLATQKTFTGPSDWLTSLTPKELEVLTCLARGMSIKAVASHLALTSKTVQTHRNNLRKKLGVTTDVELCLFAIKAGLLDLHSTEIGKR